MNSLRRIFFTARALLAELSPVTYLIGPVFFLGLLSFRYFTLRDSKDHGIISADYIFLDLAEINGLLIGAALLACTIIGIKFYTTELTEENRGSRLFSLPLSPAERFMTLLLVNWVIIPIIVLIPVMLIGQIICFLQPATLVLPAPSHLFSVMKYGAVAHILVSLLWLLPAISFPKRVWFIFIAIMIGLGSYLLFTREGVINSLDLTHELSVFNETNVVGLSNQRPLSFDAPPTEINYAIGDPVSLMSWLFTIVAVFFLAAAWVALTRKTV